MTIQTIIFQAQQLQKLNNWQKIVNLFNAYMKEGEEGWNNPDALSMYGFACSQMNHYDLAEKAYKRLIELDEAKASSWYNLGYVYYSQKRKQEASEAFVQALALYPDYMLPAYRLGVMLVDHRNYMEALMYLERGIEIYENSKSIQFKKRNNKYYVRCLFYKAKALMGLDNYTEAVQVFRDVIHKDKPNYIDSFFKYYNLARAQFKNGDIELALTNLDRVLNHNKRVEYGYFLKAQILIQMGKFSAAMDAIETAMKQRPQGYLHKTKAEILLKMNRPDDAEKELHIALKRDKKSKHKILLELGKLAWSRNQLQKARSYFEDAIEKKAAMYQSDFGEAHYFLSQVLDALGEKELAEREMEIAAELVPSFMVNDEEASVEEQVEPSTDENDFPF